MGAARTRLGLPVRDRLSDGQTPVLYASRPDRSTTLELVRSAVQGSRGGDGRAAPAPLRGLRACAGRAWAGPGTAHRLSGGVQARPAAPRRLRHGPRALGRPPGGRGERARGEDVPARRAAADAVTLSLHQTFVW